MSNSNFLACSSLLGGSIGPFGNKANIGKTACTNLSFVEVAVDVVTVGLVLEIFEFLYNTEELSQDKIAGYI